MFRAKITLTFVVSTCLLLAGTYFILHRGIQPAFKQDAEVALRRAVTIEEQSMRLDEFALASKAQFTAEDPQLYRRMLVDEDPELYEQLHAKYPQASNPVEVRHLAVYDEPLTVDKIRLQDVASRNDGRRNIDRELYERAPALPELFLVLDKNGKGVAALGKDNYKWFGDNVAQRFPIVLDAVDDNEVKTATWTWAWNESDDPAMYRVAIVPIRPAATSEPAGVVVTGGVIGDGVADRTRRLMAGITSTGDDLDTVDRADLQAAPKVAFFQGDTIAGSSFSSAHEDGLKKAAFDTAKILESDDPERLLKMRVNGDQYLAMVRFFSGDFDSSDTPAGFIVLSDLKSASSPVESAVANVWALGGVILLVGLILSLFFIQQFVKPAEQIEQGIGEVVAGRKDYQFDVDDRAPLFASIAQGLNLMSAFLQGKPMPDDAVDLDGWGELIGENDAANTGSAQVTGVAMPGQGKSESDDTTG